VTANLVMIRVLSQKYEKLVSLNVRSEKKVEYAGENLPISALRVMMSLNYP
jgi:hypothetical protein